MALVVADRVKEITSTTGTGDLSLGGAPANFIAFGSSLSDGDTTYYAIVDNTNVDYEVGVGTYTSSSNSLSRDTVFESSNSNAKVNFQAGSKDVFITYPASKSVLLDASGEILGNQTFSGSVTLNADPTSALQAATKQYVDDTAAEGIQYHSPVRVEQEGNLTATYDNGTAGVGATLTNSGTQAALVIDGITMAVNDRVLVYEQTDATQNGIYDVTNTGSASTNWVLTRSADADSYAPSDPNALAKGSGFFVQEGLLGAGEKYVCNTVGTITFGTTDITFVQVATSQIYTSGTGISITGSVISSDITLAEVTANGATTTSNVTFGNITGNTLVSNSITYPTTDGSTGQFIKTDGAGNLSFATALTATPTLDAVTTAGNNTANSITVGDINASDVSCNALTSTGIDDNATSTAITIDASERVGIKTTSLNANLEISGNTTTGGEDVVQWNNSSGVNKGMLQLSSAGGGQLQLRDAGNTVDVQISSTADSYFNGGNVGIGTTSPADELEIEGADPAIRLDDTSAGGYARLEATNGSMIYESDQGNSVANSTHIFKVDGSERMRIDSSGNVGIGTTSPSFATGSGLEIQRTSATATLRLEYTGANGYELSAESGQVTYNSVSSLPHVFEIGSSEKMRIDSSGNVGIGTASPSVKLQVNGAVTANGRLYVNEGQSASYVRIGNTGNTGGYIGYGTPDSTSLSLWTNGNVQAMTIDGSGNVGIGTTTPVNYSFDTGPDLILGDGTDNPHVSIVSPTTGTGYLAFADGTTGNAKYRGLIEYAHSTDHMGLRTAGTERIRIIDTGHVGVGTSSPYLSSWGASSKQLTVSGPTYGTLNLWGNTTRYTIGSGAGYLYFWDETNSAHRMRLNSSGFFGITSGDPLRPFYVEKSNSGDWVAEIYNTHATNGYGLKVRAGDDSSVHSFYVADVSNTGLFTVRGHGYVGIGNANPNRRLNVHEPAASTGCWSQFTNAQTGTASGAGTLVGIDSSQDFRILNYENTRLRFYTNAADRMQINANGTINANSNTGSSYLMTLTNGSTSAGEGQVLQLDASGRSTGTKDIDVFNIQNANGTIHGVRNDGQTYMQGTQSGPFVAKTTSYATKFSVLPWSGGRTYISSGVIYDSNAWVHASDIVNSCLLGIDGSSGGVWYASSNSSASWNTANAVSLWDSSGQWTATVNNGAVYTDFMRIEKASGTIMELRDTDATNATNANIYVYFQKSDGGNLGYVGYGSGSTNYLYLNNQQGDLYLGTISGGTIRLASNTNCSGSFTTGTLNVLSSASTNSTFASTSASAYVAFKSASTTTRGYIGNGPGLITGSANSDFIIRSQSTLKFAVAGNNLGATLNTAGSFTAVGDIQGANLQCNIGDYGSIAATKTRNGYYGLSCNGHLVLMSNGSAHGIYDDVNNDWWLRFYENSGVDLNYNGSKKLETTSAGVQVTGDLDFGSVRINADSHRAGLLGVYNDTGTWGGVQIRNGSWEYALMGNSSGNVGLYNDNNNEWMLYASANAGVTLYYNGASRLETTSAGVSVTGSITATSNITAYSDARLKSNIQTLDGSKVYQMRGVSFEKDGAAGSGVVAQELKEIAPELVSEDSEYLSVAYGNLVGYLIEAVKDLKAEVDELKRAAA